MTDTLNTARLLGDSTEVPANFADKIGHVIKALEEDFGTICDAPAADGANLNLNKPLGVLQFVNKRTTAEDIQAAADAVAAGRDPSPYFARGTIITSGYATVQVGGDITPGVQNLVKVNGEGKVVAVTGAETGPFWSVGSIDDPQNQGRVLADGDHVQIKVAPQQHYISA